MCPFLNICHHLNNSSALYALDLSLTLTNMPFSQLKHTRKYKPKYYYYYYFFFFVFWLKILLLFNKCHKRVISGPCKCKKFRLLALNGQSITSRLDIFKFWREMPLFTPKNSSNRLGISNFFYFYFYFLNLLQ